MLGSLDPLDEKTSFVDSICVPPTSAVFAPFAVQGQVTGKAMENKLKDVPPGFQFRLSEGPKAPKSA